MGDNEEKWKKLKHLLDNHEEFPLKYYFKFIVKAESIDELNELFSGEETDIKDSKNGNYKSFTLTKTVESSDEVIEIYKKTQGIEGLISL